MSLADEIERTRAEAEDPPPKRYYSASSDYLSLLDRAAPSIVAVLRAARASRDWLDGIPKIPRDSMGWTVLLCEADSLADDLRRALEDCDGA